VAALATVAEKDADPVVRATAVAGLTGAAKSAAKEVLAVCRKALDDEDPAVRLRAVEAAAAVGPSAEALLRWAVEQPGTLMRRTALQARSTSPSNLPEMLTEHLADKDWGISQLCAERLGTLGEAGRAAVPAAVQGATSRVKSVREAATKSLGAGPGRAQVVPAATEALAEKNLPVRAWAAEQLGKFGASGGPPCRCWCCSPRPGRRAWARRPRSPSSRSALPRWRHHRRPDAAGTEGSRASDFGHVADPPFDVLRDGGRKEGLGSPTPAVMKKLKKSLADFADEGGGDPTDVLTKLRKS
jgi:hypothetical protein